MLYSKKARLRFLPRVCGVVYWCQVLCILDPQKPGYVKHGFRFWVIYWVTAGKILCTRQYTGCIGVGVCPSHPSTSSTPGRVCADYFHPPRDTGPVVTKL